MSETIKLNNPGNFKKTLIVELSEDPTGTCYVMMLSKDYAEHLKNLMQVGGNRLGIKIIFNINKS